MQRAPVLRARRHDDRLQRRRREVVPGRGARPADGVADPDVPQPPHLADLPGHDRLARHGRAVREHAGRGHLAVPAVPEPHAVAHPDGAGEQGDVGDLLPRRPTLHFEHRAGHGCVRIPPCRGQQRRDARAELADTGAGDRRAEVHRVHLGAGGLRGELGTHAPGRRRGVVEVGGEQRVVALGEHLDQLRRGRGGRREPGVARAERGGAAHRHDGRGQLRRHGAQHPVRVRAAAVDLVDEDERRDPQPAQRPHQHAGLRLHALHRGDHQHGAVEHGQHPLHLGDEVRVAGRVDEVDRDRIRGVPDGERDDRGLDRDAALPFEREGVGLRAAVVDAADVVDDAGLVQQPFGQARLAGVNMGEDAQVQGATQASCPLDRRKGQMGWT